MRRILPRSRKGAIVLGAVVAAIALVIGSSAYVYALSGGYVPVFDDGKLIVELRIEMINAKPGKFVVATASVKMTNNYDSDILVEEFRVKVYSDPNPHSMKYGEDSKTNLQLPAHSTKVIRMNVKIENYTYFKNEGTVYAFHYIKWDHYGKTYERLGVKDVDVTYWKTLFPPLP